MSGTGHGMTFASIFNYYLLVVSGFVNIVWLISQACHSKTLGYDVDVQDCIQVELYSVLDLVRAGGRFWEVAGSFRRLKWS